MIKTVTNSYKLWYELTQILKGFWFLFIILIIFLFFIFNIVFAYSADTELNAEVQRGEELLKKIQYGQISCRDLTDENFYSIGEYGMEQMFGSSDHLLIDQMIERVHGKKTKELIHINMGERYSGCNGEKILITRDVIMKPMMNTSMMDWGCGFLNWRGWNILGPIFGFLGFLWLIMVLALPILVLILIILGILYLIKKLKNDIKNL